MAIPTERGGHKRGQRWPINDEKGFPATNDFKVCYCVIYVIFLPIKSNILEDATMSYTFVWQYSPFHSGGHLWNQNTNITVVTFKTLLFICISPSIYNTTIYSHTNISHVIYQLVTSGKNVMLFFNFPVWEKFLTCKEPCCHQSSRCLHFGTGMVAAWWVVGQNLK